MSCTEPHDSVGFTIPTAEKILNARLPVELHGHLAQLVQATDRIKIFLAVEALKSYVGQEQWQIADVQAGLQEAARGESALAQEVSGVFASAGTEADRVTGRGAPLGAQGA